MMRKFLDVQHFKFVLLISTLLYCIAPLTDLMDKWIDFTMIWMLLILIYHVKNKKCIDHSLKYLLLCGVICYGISLILNKATFVDVVMFSYVVMQLLVLTIFSKDNQIFKWYFIVGTIITLIGLILFSIGFYQQAQTASFGAFTLHIGRHPNSSLYGLIGNSNWQSFLSVSLFGIGYYLLNEKLISTQWFLSSAILQIIVVLLTNSRGGLIGLLIVVFGVLFYELYFKRKKNIWITIILTILLTGVIPLMKPIVGKTFTLPVRQVVDNNYPVKDTVIKQIVAREDSEKTESSNIRLQLNKMAIIAIQKNPLGVGISKIQETLHQVSPAFEDEYHLLSNTHNIVTQSALVMGVIPTVCIIMYICILFVKAKQHKKQGILALLIFSMLVINMFEADILMSRNFMSTFFWIVIGCFASKIEVKKCQK